MEFELKGVTITLTAEEAKQLYAQLHPIAEAPAVTIWNWLAAHGFLPNA